VDNIFMTGYAARTGIKDFLYDNFQREVKIKLVKIAGLDIKNFEENLPADLSFDLKNMENRDPVKNIFKTNDDNIPDLEYEIESMNNEALGDVVNDEVKPYFPPEKEEESKDDMSLQEELAAELGIEIKEDEEERQADNSINGEKQ